jgi:hypothetical protein
VGECLSDPFRAGTSAYAAAARLGRRALQVRSFQDFADGGEWIFLAFRDFDG